eukprot:16446379-Heterocapsa_arctica.AAC.1
MRARLRAAGAGSEWPRSSESVAEPMRAGLRIGSTEPRRTGSSTESENTEPRREMPSMATADSEQTRLLINSGGPTWATSR